MKQNAVIMSTNTNTNMNIVMSTITNTNMSIIMSTITMHLGHR